MTALVVFRAFRVFRQLFYYQYHSSYFNVFMCFAPKFAYSSLRVVNRLNFHSMGTAKLLGRPPGKSLFDLRRGQSGLRYSRITTFLPLALINKEAAVNFLFER